MLSFNNPLSSDDPISNHIDLDTLNIWYAQIFLILSNLSYIPVSLYLCYLGYGVGGIIILFSALISYFYHQCQTTRFCPFYTLDTWTMVDHITATMDLAYLFLFTISVFCLVNEKYSTIPTRRYKKSYYHTHLSLGENTFHDSWGAAVFVVYFFVVVLSTIDNPYSSQNYIVAVVFGLAIIFVQVFVINEARLNRAKDIVSVPELIGALILFVVSMVCFFIDGWLYWLPHSFWHALAGVGMLLYTIALTKHHPRHYPLFENTWYFLKRVTRTLFFKNL